MEFITISRNEAKGLAFILENLPEGVTRGFPEAFSQELSNLHEKLHSFPDAQPEPLTSTQQRLHARIRAEAPVRNAVNQKCNEITLALREHFIGLQGCKVQNLGGALNVKTRRDVSDIIATHNSMDAFRCLVDCTHHNISVKVDTTYKSTERGGIEYVKAVGFVCMLNDGIADKTYTEGYGRTDYTAEGVVARLDEIVRCISKADDIKSDITDFSHYWR